MITKENFSAVIFKILVSCISIAVTLPQILNINSGIYITVSVYMLGKLVELTEKNNDDIFLLFKKTHVYIIILNLIAIAACFYAIAESLVLNGNSYNSFTQSYWFCCPIIVVSVFDCLVDISNLIYYASKNDSIYKALN